MKQVLLVSAAVGLALAAGPLRAQCSPENVPSGGTALCAGVGEGGFADGSENVTVRVVPGAVITAPAAAIEIGGDFSTLQNAGTLRSQGDGVAGGNGFTLVNEGVITARHAGVNLSGQEMGTLTNHGSITAGRQAVHMDADGGRGGTDHAVINTGLIVSTGGVAVEGGDDNTLTNHAVGRIQGRDDAVQFGENATLVNHGIIRSIGGGDDPQGGIDIHSGLVTNMSGGRVLSEHGAAIELGASARRATIDNAGEIRGVTGIVTEAGPHAANRAPQDITNRATGKIVGSGGIALSLGGGKDRFVNEAGAEIIGSAHFGEDDDLLVLEGSPAGMFGGAGAVFDGGTGTDTIRLAAYSFDQITAVTLLTDGVALSFDNGVGAFEITLTNWDRFQLAGESYTEGDIVGLVSNKVPLPAGMALLVSALVGLGILGARRSRV